MDVFASRRMFLVLLRFYRMFLVPLCSRRMFFVSLHAMRMFCRIDSSVLWEAKEGAA